MEHEPSVRVSFCTDPYCWDPTALQKRISSQVKGKDVAQQLAELYNVPVIDMNSGVILELQDLCSARIEGVLCPGYCSRAPIAQVTVNGKLETIQLADAVGLVEMVRRLVEKSSASSD